MGAPFTLQNEFLGMWQDSSIDALPAGKLWTCADLIPEYLGAPLRKRGGWSYACPSMSNQYIDGLIYSPTVGSGSYAIGGDANFYSFNASGSTSLGVLPGAIFQNPITHRTGTTPLIVIPIQHGHTGSAGPYSYDGSTFQQLAGSPPDASYADVWNDHTLLAYGKVSTTSFPQRMWFSPVGDAAGTWDTTNSWLDTSGAIAGIAAIRTGILVFHGATTDLITGTTPPSATSIGDLTQKANAFSVGCLDARTIAKYNDTVIWADSRGIYQSDGNTVKDLSAAGGISSYWRNLVPTFGGAGLTGVTVAAGIYHDTYIITANALNNGAGGHVHLGCLAYDILRGFWYQLNNFGFRCFATQTNSTINEMYMGTYNHDRVAACSTVFTPSESVKTDGDGGSVQPSYQTGFFRGWQHWHRKWVPSMAIQSWRRVYLSYELIELTGGTNITISYATDPNASSFTSLSPTLAETTGYARQHRDIFIQGNGIMFTVAQTGTSADTRLHALEVEYTPLETSRLAQ